MLFMYSYIARIVRTGISVKLTPLFFFFSFNFAKKSMKYEKLITKIFDLVQTIETTTCTSGSYSLLKQILQICRCGVAPLIPFSSASCALQVAYISCAKIQVINE